MLNFLNAHRRDRSLHAVIDPDGSYSFAQLAWCAGGLAARIRSIDPPPATIAIHGSHGAATYSAIIGALASARRIVFVDQATPVATIDTMLRALGVDLLLNCGGAAAGGDWRVLDAPALAEPPAGADDAPALSLSCVDYAIFTSGTSGEPKAIVQTMAALAAHIDNYVGYVDVAAGDRLLQLASSAWDAGLMDIFGSLLRGACLCTINPRVHDLDQVRRFIERHDIDTLHMTVPYFRRLYADDTAVPPTKKCVVGGELIYASDLARFEAAFAPGSTLYNAYGPTECTTALYARHVHGMARPEKNWGLAHPVAQVAVALWHEGAAVTEPGLVGELIVRSPLIARRFDTATGQLVALTREGADGAAPYYATGDLAYHDRDGAIVICGRTDSVIKVNGLKVSLNEVEAALRAMPAVRDVCLLALESEDGAVLCAAVVPASGALTEAMVRGALAAALAGHKVPRHVLMLAALPLNRNNKLDRAALAEALAAYRRRPAADAVDAASPLMRAVRVALSGAEIDPGISFLDNGGDSLRALQVVAALKRQGRLLRLEQLVSATPLGELTLGTPRPAATPVAVPVVSAVPDARLPNRHFITTRGIPDLDRWCQSCVFDRDGAADLAGTAALVRAVLTRHVRPWAGDGWPLLEVDGPFEEAVRLTEQKISLAAGRPLAVAIARSGDTVHVIISCHQFHVDRYSWLLLLAELAAGAADALPAIAHWPAAPPFTAWERHYREHLAPARQPALWEELPWDAAAPLGPVEAVFPARQAFYGELVPLGSPAGGMPPKQISELLLAASLLALAELTDNPCQKVHVLDHGRDLTPDFDTYSMFGWFTLIYPLVLRLAGQGLQEAAGQVADYIARMRPHAHTFGNAHFGTRAARRLGGRYDCGASYNFLGDINIAAAAGWRVHPLSMHTMHGAASHHLELTGYLSEGQLFLHIDYDPAVHAATTIAALRAGLLRRLAPAA